MKIVNAVESKLKSEVKLIGKHSLVYVLGQSLTRAAGFFMIPIYTHYFAPADYGVIELIEIISGILLLTISIGASDGMSRYYYNEKKNEKRNEVVSTVIIGFSVISMPLIAIFWMSSEIVSKTIFINEKHNFILKISFVTTWFTMLCEIGYTYLRIVYKAKIFVIITTFQLLLALTLNIIFIVYLQLDIISIFYSNLITQFIVSGLLILRTLNIVGNKYSPTLLYEMLKYGMPLVPSRIGLMLGFISNRFFLRWMGTADPVSSLAQIGIYSLGQKFGVAVYQFVSAPLNSFWSPRRMELLLSDIDDSKKTVARVCTYTTFCSIFAGLILSSSISSVIDIMADPRYYGAHIVVPFVVLSYIALGIENHFITGILISKNTKLTTYITIISLLIIVLWNYIFIPRYGLIGAATSNLAGYIPRLVLIYYFSQKLYFIPFEIIRLMIMLLVATVLYLASQMVVFDTPYANLVARIAISSTFPILLFVIGFFYIGERKFIFELIRKGQVITKSVYQTIFVR